MSKKRDFLGVALDQCSRKWQASIDGTPIRGLFNTEIEAAIMRMREIKRRATLKQPNEK